MSRHRSKLLVWLGYRQRLRLAGSRLRLWLDQAGTRNRLMGFQEGAGGLLVHLFEESA